MPTRTPASSIHSILIVLSVLASLTLPTLAYAQWTDVTGSILGDASSGAGAAWGDYDGDGDLDLYLANYDAANVLFRNNGAGFSYAVAGPLLDTGSGLGAVWGDYDNDGDLDLYLSNNGANKLFRNEGGSSVFVDVTSGPLGDTGVGTGVAWADYDKDGDLDLYLANSGQANKLFRNDGGGTFADVTSGPLGDTGNGRGVAWADYDNDGDLDLYLSNYGQANKLFRNDGGGVFADATSGPLGNAGSGLGAAWGDYDNDGDLDLYLSNTGANVLCRNDGGGTFTDVTSGSLGNIGAGTSTGWGDYDNDGDLDLYLVLSGTNMLLRNDGGGTFTDVSSAPVADTGSGTSFAWGDYNGDGSLDIYVSNNGANKLFYNAQATGNHWLQVSAVGLTSNPSGIGARVRVVAGGTVQIREISAGAGYLTQNSLTAEFGLGTATLADTVEVYWSDGSVDRQTGVAVDQLITMIQGEPLWTDAGTALLEYNGGLGMAWGDYDGDGDIDIYKTSWGLPNALYRNDGGVFVDATSYPLDDASNSSGAAWGDYDNDGDPDLYLANSGANKLFRNDGAGSFTDVTSGVLGIGGDSRSVSWVDYDKDGKLDIFIARWGFPNRLFRNLGGGAFSDVTAGDLLVTGHTLGASWADYDLDGDMDVYVANDQAEANALYRNDGGVFMDVTSGALAGGTSRSFSAAWGDYDNDKDPDLYIVNAAASNQLLRNDGAGVFVPVTSGPLGIVAYGENAAWGDYDNDGDLDLYVVNFLQVNKLLRNDGGGAFTDVFGLPVADALGGQTCGWGDYDNDGDLDLYVSNSSSDKLLRNDQKTGNFWLHVNLEGAVSNHSGIGARVSVNAGGVTQTREVTAGSGYVSQNSLTAEFGLGPNTIVDVLEVQWPSGITDKLTNVPANQAITVLEGVSWTDVSTPVLAGDISAVSEGMAWGDFDSDGDLDIYVGNRGQANKLLEGRGTGVFADATTPVSGGLTETTWSTAWGDYDNDGDIDLFVANGVDPNWLLRNDGGGIFTDVASGTLANAVTIIGVWGDYDNDGDIDLYLANFAANMLMRNDGGGVFVDVTSPPLDDVTLPYAAAWGDYDDDGDLDLYVSNSGANKLFRNDGGGVFADATIGPLGDAGTGGGVDWGDFDNDGDLDLYLANQGSANKLFRNDGSGIFVDATTAPLGVTASSKGVGWADYDNDGDLDLYAENDAFVGSGLYRNDGGGAFTDVAPPVLADAVSGTGVAWGDYDNDGDLDLYRCSFGYNQLFRNELSLGNHWLHVDLVGTASNGSGIGMRVRVVVGGMSQIREVSGGSGYRSQNSLTAEFGLGATAIVDTVEVEWTTGVVDRLPGVATDQRITLTETPPWTVIMSVADVPDDQGGWVRIHFQRSGFDRAEVAPYPITTYHIYRRVDTPAPVAEAGVGGALTPPPGTWDLVTSMAARNDDNYIALVPTLVDSSGAGPGYTAWYISAHTRVRGLHYDSPADSGYSVDNIAPGVPQGVAAMYNTGSGNQLSWDPAPEPDFQHYNIYRGTDPDFEPDPGHLVHSTTSTGWTDPDHDDVTVSYKVTALDQAGNESGAGSHNPATGASGPKLPARDALYQNVPNPFNPSTTIQYALRAPSDVTLTVFDAAGRRIRTLVDTSMPAGVHDVTWDGFDQRGSRVASGVYFYRLEAGAFTQTRKMVLLK